MSDHWHYQLMYHTYVDPDPGEEGYYAIHEYYKMADCDHWSRNPVEVIGDSIEDVKKSLMLMLQDIDKHGVMRD